MANWCAHGGLFLGQSSLVCSCTIALVSPHHFQGLTLLTRAKNIKKNRLGWRGCCCIQGLCSDARESCAGMNRAGRSSPREEVRLGVHLSIFTPCRMLQKTGMLGSFLLLRLIRSRHSKVERAQLPRRLGSTPKSVQVVELYRTDPLYARAGGGSQVLRFTI